MNILDKIENSALLDKFSLLKWWQKLLVLSGMVLFLLLLIDFVIMPFYTRLGSEYTLPDVTEKKYEAAVKELNSNGFIPVVQDSIYDADHESGLVLRQNPPSFSTVKRGRRVYLVVSRGEKPIYMPDLTSMTQQNAEFKLRESGLKLGSVSQRFSSTHPYRGTVIAQSELPGDRVSQNSAVHLTISLGPPPASRTIPQLVGKSLEAAQRELEVLNIPLGSIRTFYRPKLVPNTVIAQSVAAGTSLGEVTTVDLEVSTDVSP